MQATRANAEAQLQQRLRIVETRLLNRKMQGISREAASATNKSSE